MRIHSAVFSWFPVTASQRINTSLHQTKSVKPLYVSSRSSNFTGYSVIQYKLTLINPYRTNVENRVSS